MTDLAPLQGPHWDFALALYGRDAVPEACLRLQDRYGLDVIVLIAVLYAALRRDRTPQADDLARMDTELERWRRDVVHPLRGVRRVLKASPYGAEAEALRTDIKSMELRAEQIELARAVRLAESFSGGPARTEDRLLAVAVATVRHFAGRDDPEITAATRPIARQAATLAADVQG